jgi:outer membrane lipoprotein-sorting protein
MKMNKSIPAIIASVVLFASAPALASSCPKDMKAIDAKLQGEHSLSASQMQTVKELRKEGEALHKAGRHAESMAALHSALEMLDN